ncbi:MAG: glycine zipper 2TM domain-containing protein [Zymomonas mobilis]|uniref:17 kDa surface antigen n=1 Tax=Zymomonas mobilis TaxID=542 RepID=A0A542W008_ZYMMB|nr:glycine zipper 2TM domain-containing protein [Zymomonas mobilis]TQL16922.1 glycine zipper 2TM protein [Zymomonas mobilis]
MKRLSFALALILMAPLSAVQAQPPGGSPPPNYYGDRNDGRYQGRDNRDDRGGYRGGNGGGRDDGYYGRGGGGGRRGGGYRDSRLGPNDRIYRGGDGRYYCHRSDGTTGTIIGALGGGLLGDVIAPGGSKTIGTLLGAGGGALIGRQIDRNKIRCR